MTIKEINNYCGIDNTTLQRNIILSIIESKKIRGATCQELSYILSINNMLVYARLRELERKNKIVKTSHKRKTGKNKRASVYISIDIADRYNIEYDKKETKIEKENKELRNAVVELAEMLEYFSETTLESLYNNMLDFVKFIREQQSIKGKKNGRK